MDSVAVGQHECCVHTVHLNPILGAGSPRSRLHHQVIRTWVQGLYLADILGLPCCLADICRTWRLTAAPSFAPCLVCSLRLLPCSSGPSVDS